MTDRAQGRHLDPAFVPDPSLYRRSFRCRQSQVQLVLLPNRFCNSNVGRFRVASDAPCQPDPEGWRQSEHGLRLSRNTRRACSQEGLTHLKPTSVSELMPDGSLT